MSYSPELRAAGRCLSTSSIIVHKRTRSRIGASAAQAAETPAPTAHYDMSHSGTSLTDVSGNGRDATLVVWSPDYDGKGKAWVRYDDGSEATVGGSRVERG